MTLSVFSAQFNAHKSEFLKGSILEDWERAAVRSYSIVKDIRSNLGVFFVLLIVNGIFRLIVMNNARGGVQDAMMLELGGFALVGVIALVAFFVPRWWLILLTAIAIFPFALGIITGLMAIVFLCTMSGIKRANAELYLSNSDYMDLVYRFDEIVTGKLDTGWPELGKMGRVSVRVRFFENAAVFVVGKRPLNCVSRADAQQCIIETDKKGRDFIKKWIVDGKLKKTNIPLSSDGCAQLKEWMAGMSHTSALVG